MTGGPVNEEGFWDEDSLALEDGSDFLCMRIDRGVAALKAGADADEPETMASDTISNILTALYGPAGTGKFGLGMQYEEEAIRAAKAMLDYAFHSWEGDAEDYTRKVD